ncbi:single-stranded DNA-binding protein [Fictibacillus sp. 5RED26]|uniref:single-stranded DNA-binding protein n=1 Tax=Fictibacillus sp. 5RED26 TaxID=2745876 RepID=UPI0018CE4119|nr:single-stranded DNA-binding protein [Fictibacillus sp. 5RED26]MBH0157306.1 single-stranded DNA-binding protein [Fictibacillus sp. 5RED26]
MDCMRFAIQEVENLIHGESFLVKDLFKGYEWNRLSIGDRRSLGSLFLHEAKYGGLKESIIVGLKSSANQQQYIKR